MISLVHKTLETYLREKRIITQSEFPSDVASFLSRKDAVFVTLYLDGHVIASSGRIVCQKENSVFECIDNTLLCLKDERFSQASQSIDVLDQVRVRVDVFSSQQRRVLQNIDELDTSREGLIFLSQNLGIMSVVLPQMVNVDPTPNSYFDLACKKAKVDAARLTQSDYVIYGLKTEEYTDMK